jgi:hypothetical protein
MLIKVFDLAKVSQHGHKNYAYSDVMMGKRKDGIVVCKQQTGNAVVIFSECIKKIKIHI